MNKLPYKEGDIFAVSLRGGGFVLGVIARVAPGGKVLLGYFFKKKWLAVPALKDVPALDPQGAAMISRFGDLSLIGGEWPIIGSLESWNREIWSMPKFIRHDLLVKQRAWLISYDNDDPSKYVARERCDPDAEGYEKDAMRGAGAIELALTRLAKAA